MTHGWYKEVVIVIVTVLQSIHVLLWIVNTINCVVLITGTPW